MKKRGTNRKIWAARITEWKRSGLTQKRYCAEQGVPQSTFQWWRNRLKESSETAESTALVEVSPPVSNGERIDGIAITVGRYTVRLPGAVDALSRVLDVLEWR